MLGKRTREENSEGFVQKKKASCGSTISNLVDRPVLNGVWLQALYCGDRVWWNQKGTPKEGCYWTTNRNGKKLVLADEHAYDSDFRYYKIAPNQLYLSELTNKPDEKALMDNCKQRTAKIEEVKQQRSKIRKEANKERQDKCKARIAQCGFTVGQRIRCKTETGVITKINKVWICVISERNGEPMKFPADASEPC